jgi:HD-GYP domain-containing protein (c-di-GMP phosphodiesterase class II)
VPDEGSMLSTSPAGQPILVAGDERMKWRWGSSLALRRRRDDAAHNLHLEQARQSFGYALLATLDARDRRAALHSLAVAIYARDIAARLGLSKAEQQHAHVCGLVHDIGMIALPSGLLEKPGSLTLAERREMETHSEIGERILSAVAPNYAEIAPSTRHHHERWDGKGYPDGLSGEDIPLMSRIIAVAEAYNAMTSDHPYGDPMPTRVARLRLTQCIESTFDPAVVAAFEAILAGASEDYRSADRSDFMLDTTSSADRSRLAVSVSNSWD